MKTHYVITVIFGLLAMVGCSTMDHSWSLKPPQSKASPWHRVLSAVTFSNTPLPEALMQLEQMANSVAQPDIRLRLSTYDDGVFDNEIPRVPVLEARNISLYDMLQLIGEVTDCRPIYGKSEVIFARRCSFNGLTPILLEGHCCLRKTRSPVKQFSLICTQQATSDGAPVTKIYTIQTDSEGNFSQRVPVAANLESVRLGPGDRNKCVLPIEQPAEQRMEIIAISDACYPSRMGVDLVGEKLHYRLEIEMEK